MTFAEATEVDTVTALFASPTAAQAGEAPAQDTGSRVMQTSSRVHGGWSRGGGRDRLMNEEHVRRSWSDTRLHAQGSVEGKRESERGVTRVFGRSLAPAEGRARERERERGYCLLPLGSSVRVWLNGVPDWSNCEL